MPVVDIGVSACILAVAVGFVLLAALAASSMSPAATPPAMAPVSAAAISDRKSFAIRWWEAFRLVLLLAIGPALVALALATAPMAFRVATKVKPLPGGGSVRIETNPDGDTYVTTTDASGRQTSRLATDAEIAEAGPAPPTQTHGALLQVAALATVTVLAHGAAFVSLGAALGVWIRRRSRAIAASVGLVLFVTVGWPIVYLNIFGDPNYPRWGLALASVLPAFSGLLFDRSRPAVDREHERMGRLLGRDPDPVGRRHLGAGDPNRGPQVPKGSSRRGRRRRCLAPAGRRRVWERRDLERGEGHIKVGLASPGRRMIRDSSMPLDRAMAARATPSP